MKLLSDITRDVQHPKTTPGSYEWWYFDGISEEGDYQLVIIFYDGCPFSTRYIRETDAIEKARKKGKRKTGGTGKDADSGNRSGKGAKIQGAQSQGPATAEEPDQNTTGSSDVSVPFETDPAYEEGQLPTGHPAISISVYHKGEPIFYSLSQYHPDVCTFDPEQPAVTVGENSFRFSERETHGNREFSSYDIRINERLPSGDELKGIITFSGMNPNERLLGNDKTESDGHVWNMVFPASEMQCRMNLIRDGLIQKELKFNGTGYHDHNTGTEPMKNQFRDWYWGRVHFPQATLVYYVMHGKDGEDYRAWLISSDNRRQLQILELKSLKKRRMNGFLMRSARRLIFEGNDVEVIVNLRKPVDSGPFYGRYICEAALKQPGFDTETAEGIAEYIRPDRIHRRRYWPLVHMRFRYADQKPHWVQRSRRLYRWTW